jgi:hypothetical protein
MVTFKEWLALQESSGLTKQDFTGLSQAQRMAQGRDIGEPFIKAQLKAHGLDIKDVPTSMDIGQKVDGMLNGNPIQIKLRRSGADGRNDISYEVCRNHNNRLPLQDQLLDFHQQGRDYRGKVKLYFVMNQDETEIYEVPADLLKNSVLKALEELGRSRMNGILSRAFTASDGTELRPTRDRDPKSFTPTKVMAFIPVAGVINKSYPIDATVRVGGTAATAVVPAEKVAPTPKWARQEFVQHAEDAKSLGSKTFAIGSTQPKKKQEKIEDAKQFATSQGLKISINPDNTITFTK